MTEADVPRHGCDRTAGTHLLLDLMVQSLVQGLAAATLDSLQGYTQVLDLRPLHYANFLNGLDDFALPSILSVPW
jgi:hypothetical protein